MIAIALILNDYKKRHPKCQSAIATIGFNSLSQNYLSRKVKVSVSVGSPPRYDVGW